MKNDIEMRIQNPCGNRKYRCMVIKTYKKNNKKKIALTNEQRRGFQTDFEQII